jgi:hypothetical protein
MTKKQFIAHMAANGCSAHYQGSTRTMFIFGSHDNLRNATRQDIKSGKAYMHYSRPIGGELLFSVMPQATS